MFYVLCFMFYVLCFMFRHKNCKNYNRHEYNLIYLLINVYIYKNNY